MSAGEAAERHEHSGILDCAVEGSGPELLLLRSSDEGGSWTIVSAVAKPHYMLSFDKFVLRKDGQGRLTMLQADDDGGPKPGFYHYQTVDGGKTWTGPTYEASGLDSVDEMKDDQKLRAVVQETEQETPHQPCK